MKSPFSLIIDLANDISKKKIHEVAVGGGSTHVALKIFAARFIESFRNKKALFEQPFCGYYPDVISTDKSIIAECGHTQNPDKMLDYFRQGNICECIQVPYPDIDDDIVSGFSFTAAPTLCEFLDFLSNARRGKIKELISKRR